MTSTWGNTSVRALGVFMRLTRFLLQEFVDDFFHVAVLAVDRVVQLCACRRSEILSASSSQGLFYFGMRLSVSWRMMGTASYGGK